MTNPALTQFLIDITRGPLKQAYAQDPAAVLNDSDLGPDARQAVKTADIATLWRIGVAPMALLYFSRLSGWAMDDYYACISQASLKTAGSGLPAPPAPDAPKETNQ